MFNLGRPCPGCCLGRIYESGGSMFCSDCRRDPRDYDYRKGVWKIKNIILQAEPQIDV